MIDGALLAIELLVLILLLRRLRLSSRKGGAMSLGVFAYPEFEDPKTPRSSDKLPGKRHA